MNVVLSAFGRVGFGLATARTFVARLPLGLVSPPRGRSSRGIQPRSYSRVFRPYAIHGSAEKSRRLACGETESNAMVKH